MLVKNLLIEKEQNEIKEQIEGLYAEETRSIPWFMLMCLLTVVSVAAICFAGGRVMNRIRNVLMKKCRKKKSRRK